MNAVQVQETEESPGVTSWMRKNGRIALWTGVWLTVAGVLTGVAALLLGRYEMIPVVTAEVAGGPGLIAVALGAKAWQSQAEGRGDVYKTAERGPVSPPDGA